MPPRSKTLETQIDENLRRVFEEDAAAELPDRLLDLLKQLDEIDAPASPTPQPSGQSRGSSS
jgi:hypothetical protein